ncbi:hypothetical protein GF358_00965 [Candidatus Woesearchaeota archaeon]|nr:hypothetical protein [Candidatus Woesearchaeota archaeon]
MAGELILDDMRELNKTYLSSFSHSFYVRGNPNEVANAVASLCSNATHSSSAISIHVDIDGLDEIIRDNEKVNCVYIVESTYHKPEFRKILKSLQCSILRALIVGFDDKQGVSEIIPFGFELYDNEGINLGSVIDRINSRRSKTS